MSLHCMALCVQMWLVAVDVAGNAQASPYLINIQTLPDTSAPVPLIGSGPGSVSCCSSLMLPRCSHCGQCNMLAMLVLAWQSQYAVLTL